MAETLGEPRVLLRERGDLLLAPEAAQIDGTDLERLLQDAGGAGLPLSSVLGYLADAAEALAFLHGQQPPAAHGDVRPANLILTHGGRVKLLEPVPTPPGAVAPTRAEDVLALAATACTLLTGSPDTPERAPDPRVAAALRAGLSGHPDGRPATPEAVVEELRAAWAESLPTGTMTFLMSDIEESTRLWEERPVAMAEALVRHDELIASVVASHGGRFIKSMGEGDSTTSVFESAGAATLAAIDATLALAREQWPVGASLRVRFGLHAGEAQRRGTVYFGTTINLAARVRGEAGGGEILLSERAAGLAASELPPGYSVVDLGPHRLKGIARPEPIRALVGPGLATPVAGASCPYRGLLAFGPEQRHLFFGREDAVEEAVARTARGRLLAVVGASGSGKSSLLRAGLLAAVQAGELPAARRGRVITPGAEPPVDPPSGVFGDVNELIVVDQFEELYTQCRDPERRARFIAQLLAHPGPVAIGLRADFYGEVSKDPDLADAVSRNQLLLGPMRDADLRRAIAEPARLAGLRLEPGLIDLVLRDVDGEPGALPLMSHALRETWERRDGRTLTVAAYRESGGVSSAVAQTADAVAQEIPADERPLLRSVFLRLTELGDDVEDTRRRVNIDELAPEGVADETVRELLERLADARLITLGEGTAEVAHEVLIRRWPTLRRWLEEDREGFRLHRRLGDAVRLWEAAAREPADLYRGTRLDAALEWARANPTMLNNSEREFLRASAEEAAAAQRRQLRINRRLRRALAGAGVLTLAAVALLVFALISRHDAVKAEGTAHSQALATEAEGQVVRDPQRALLLARAALRAAPTAEAELAASEALDANTARSQLPSFGVQGCLTANFLFLFDGGRLAGDNTCNGHVVLGDLRARRIVARIRVGPSSTDMVRGPGDHTLLVASGRSLYSVDVDSHRVRRIFVAPFTIDQVAGGAPPARYLALADNDTVGLADLRTGRLRVIGHGDASANIVNGMMPAGPDLLLIASTGQSRGRGDLEPGLTVLNVVTGARSTVTLERRPHLAAVNFLRVSPDGRTWYVTGADIDANNSLEVATTWAVDAATGRLRWAARGPSGALASPIQVSPDSRLVAVGYSSGAADVLDARTGELVVREASSSSIAAGDLSIPPGDDSLVTVSLDGVLRTWATHGSEQLRMQAPPDPALDFTSDGSGLLLVGTRGEVVDRRSGRVVRRFGGFPVGSVFNTCNSACFSASPGLRWLTYLDPASATPRIVEVDGRSGRRVASVDVPRLDAQGVAPDGRVAVAWVDDGRMSAQLIDPGTDRVVSLQTARSSAGCAAAAPSFTPDSGLMAVTDGCVTVNVWNLRSGRLRRTITLPDRPSGSSALLSPGGRYVLVAVLGGAFVRADLRTGHVVEVPGAAAEGNVLAISPDGRYYAIGRQDGTVDVYDSRTLRLIRRHDLSAAIQALAFSPDSRELAVEDNHDTVWVWDTCAVCENARALAASAARHSVRTLTPSERATFNVS